MYLDYSTFKKDSTQFNFNLEKNIQRLKKQQYGDYACYYLAIFSFIEGFLRKDSQLPYEDKLTNYDNQKKTNLSNLLFSYKNKYYNCLNKKSVFDHLLFFGCKDNYYDNYYASANRIRHCFIEQDTNTLGALINEFIEFSKIFNFYNEDVQSLLENEEIFHDQINRQKNQKTEELQKENLELEKSLAEMLKNNPSLMEAFNKIDFSDEEAVEKLSGDLKDFAENKSLLKNNQTMLSYYAKSWRDYQNMMSKLTEEQKEIENYILDSINKDKKENYVIQAGPGTGKTIVLIDLLRKLIDSDIALLTYTSSLNKYNKYIASTISFDNKILTEKEKEKITTKIKTFDEYLIKKAERILNRKVYISNPKNDFKDKDSEKIIELIKQELDLYNNPPELTAYYILSEAINEIWGLMPPKKAYIDHSYSNGKPTTDKEELKKRKIVLNCVEKLEKQLDENSEAIPLEYASYKLATFKIPDSEKVDYLLVDETQDLCNSKLYTISNITRKKFIIAGDLAQSVFIRKGLSWQGLVELLHSKKTILIKPELTKNFRSTAPIQDLANTFLEKVKIQSPDKIFSEGFMPGPTPDYTITKNNKDSLKKIAEHINALKQQFYFSNKDFCIVASTGEELKQIKEALGPDLPSSKMEDPDFDFSKDDKIKLSTVKYVKGIDCPVIILLLTKNFKNSSKNGELDKNGQMNGIYACITRAMNILSIFIEDENNMLEKDQTSSIGSFYKVLKEKAINQSELK